MKQTLVVVADLGRFKAFERVKGRRDSHPHLHLLEEKQQVEVRTRLSEQVTDSAGRFPRASGPLGLGGAGMSIGDRHDIALENQRRALHAIAMELNRLLSGDEYDGCWLAAAAPIQRPLLEELQPGVRAKIRKTLPLDLTKVNPNKLLSHFES